MPECSGAPMPSSPAWRDRAVDHGLMREGAARAAVFLRHAAHSRPACAELVPGRALHDAVLGPTRRHAARVRSREALRLLLEQHEVLGHPGGPRDLQGSIGARLRHHATSSPRHVWLEAGRRLHQASTDGLRSPRGDELRTPPRAAPSCVSAPVGDAREVRGGFRQHALHEEAAGDELGLACDLPRRWRRPSACSCAALAICAHM